MPYCLGENCMKLIHFITHVVNTFMMAKNGPCWDSKKLILGGESPLWSEIMFILMEKAFTKRMRPNTQVVQWYALYQLNKIFLLSMSQSQLPDNLEDLLLFKINPNNYINNWYLFTGQQSSDLFSNSCQPSYFLHTNTNIWIHNNPSSPDFNAALFLPHFRS